jgi:hypothetical protein
MNKNVLQIFITRSFFVVASPFLYQRVQGEKAHPMAPLSGAWEPFLAPRNRNIIFYQATASPGILPSNVIALRGESYNMLCVL